MLDGAPAPAGRADHAEVARAALHDAAGAAHEVAAHLFTRAKYFRIAMRVATVLFLG